jgi:hypothetical protein
METSFIEIATSSLNIVEFARCPYIYDIYSHMMLQGFCDDSYSGFYNVHVSHLSTLTVFFALMVNAALLYPHYKGKTLKHLCFCFYSKEVLDEENLVSCREDSVFILEDLDYSSDDSDSKDSDSEYDEDDDVEAGQHVELVVRHPERVDDNDGADLSTTFADPAFHQTAGAFTFVNPTFNGGFPATNGSYMTPSTAMVRVKAEEDMEGRPSY